MRLARTLMLLCSAIKEFWSAGRKRRKKVDVLRIARLVSTQPLFDLCSTLLYDFGRAEEVLVCGVETCARPALSQVVWQPEIVIRELRFQAEPVWPCGIELGHGVLEDVFARERCGVAVADRVGPWWGAGGGHKRSGRRLPATVGDRQYDYLRTLV